MRIYKKLVFSFFILNITQSFCHNLVPVTKFIPDVILDIKYATKDNFTNTIVYKSSKCYLLEPVAKALEKAAKEFEVMGYKIKIWDGYRPLSVQYKFWELVPDEKYIADPKKGSRHNRGAAVDITLVKQDGSELDMGTEFDNFTEKAHRNYKNLTRKVIKNRKVLEDVMVNNGFIGLPTEWWHFDFVGYEKYPILDIPFEEIKNE